MKRPATHEDLARVEEIVGSSDRSFGLVFSACFLVIGLWPLVHRNPTRGWALVLAAAFFAIALIRPALLGPLNRLWLRLGLLLQRIVSPVVLALLYFTTITPMGLLMRLLGKNPLRLGFDPDAKTYWIERRPPGPAPETMRRQF